MKLDIACGQRKEKGFKGVDIAPLPNVDFVWDLEKYPWEPFPDNSCEEILISHYAEHAKDLIRFMDEVWRIAKPDAKVTITTPYYTSIRAWQDPTHVRAFSEVTWLYFSQQKRTEAKLEHYDMRADFDIVNTMVFFNPPWDKKSDEAREFAKNHYWNVITDMVVELKALKS